MIATEQLKNSKTAESDKRMRKKTYEAHDSLMQQILGEKLPDEWKEALIVPIYNKGDKRMC